MINIKQTKVLLKVHEGEDVHKILWVLFPDCEKPKKKRIISRLLGAPYKATLAG